jgi:hypothetical protein
LLVGLGLGGVVLLGAIAGIGVYVAKHMGMGSLPLEANKLPSQTKEIDSMIIDATRESNDRIKKIYLASEMSSAFCSGRGDPANHLETLGLWGSKSAKEFFVSSIAERSSRTRSTTTTPRTSRSRARTEAAAARTNRSATTSRSATSS